MSFPQRSNGFYSQRKEKGISPVSIFVVIFLIGIFALPISRDFLFRLCTPLWNSENAFTSFIDNDLALLKSKQSLVAENNSLQEQIELNQENTMLDTVVRTENDDLKNILNRKPAGQDQILAAIFVKPFLSPYDTLIIDAGTAVGVSVGDRVLANGNFYIGTVSQADNDSAKVTLFSSPGEKIQVLVGANAIEQEATGLGGGNFSIQMPKGSNIAVGDSIILPSISPNIFATVGRIDSEVADSFETIAFRIPVNIDTLQWVEVVPSLNK